jgi:hypothetical protein
LQRAAGRSKAATQEKARATRRTILERTAARKKDARAKIIIGGTIGAAIREKVPQAAAIAEMLKASLSAYDWKTIVPALSPSVQPDSPFSFPVMMADQRNSTDEIERRKQAAHQKIIIGGAVIAALKKDEPLAAAMIDLLNQRIGSLRDRETVRSVAPIPEFREIRGR